MSTEYLSLLLFIAKWWVVCSLCVNEFYGVTLLYIKRQWGRELAASAVDGSMVTDILTAPLFLLGLTITAFFYPSIVYLQNSRERKRMYRTKYQMR